MWLKSNVGGHWIKLHTGSYSREGEPDVIGCVNGQFYAFELKTKKGKMSAMQKHKLKLINQAGGIAMCINDIRELEDVFD